MSVPLNLHLNAPSGERENRARFPFASRVSPILWASLLAYHLRSSDYGSPRFGITKLPKVRRRYFRKGVIFFQVAPRVFRSKRRACRRNSEVPELRLDSLANAQEVGGGFNRSWNHPDSAEPGRPSAFGPMDQCLLLENSTNLLCALRCGNLRRFDQQSPLANNSPTLWRWGMGLPPSMSPSTSRTCGSR